MIASKCILLSYAILTLNCLLELSYMTGNSSLKMTGSRIRNTCMQTLPLLLSLFLIHAKKKNDENYGKQNISNSWHQFLSLTHLDFNNKKVKNCRQNKKAILNPPPKKT